ncbi:MAG: lipocalin family protein [Reichenbachiella sp.]|uniref:lipocalin family protein n=1 Tax=Reichenbachiella sp. TaxID=2184521 RepID=UPI00326674CA
MKYLRYIFWTLLTVITGCSVVVEEGNDASESNTITFENVFPNSLIDANTYLLGGGNRTWTTVAFTIEGVNGFQNCRLDDEIRLNEDNTYAYDGGTMLCGAEDNQKIKSGTWEIDAPSRTLTFDKGLDHESIMYIESLTSEEIVVSSHYYSWKVVGKFTHD